MESKQNYTTPETRVVEVTMQTTLLQGSVLVEKGGYDGWITDGWS